jgi:hypothetical protein
MGVMVQKLFVLFTVYTQMMLDKKIKKKNNRGQVAHRSIHLHQATVSAVYIV